MIAQATLEKYRALIDRLPSFVPPDALIRPGLPLVDDPEFLSPQALPPDPGRCAVIGVIDHAIPFAHRLLTTASGHSRVAAIWLQDAPAQDRRCDIAFGQELRGHAIDHYRLGAGARRGEAQVYRRFGVIDPARRGGVDLQRMASHGAAVTALAAGFAPGDPQGLDHPLIAVSLPDFSVADTSGSFSPLFIQAAVFYILARARALARALGQELPVVINLSMGLTAGSLDGSALVTQLQDSVASQPDPLLGPVQFILPSGNSRQGRLRGTLAPGGTMQWHLPPDDRTPSALELWGPASPLPQPPLRLTLQRPGGSAIATQFGGPGLARLLDDTGHEAARLMLQTLPAGGDHWRQRLTLIVPPTRPAAPGAPTAPPGRWRITLCADSPGPCTIAVQRDDTLPGFRPGGRQSGLVAEGYRRRTPDGHWPEADPDNLPPGATAVRRNGTVNALATGQTQLRVGAAHGRGGQGLPPYGGLLEDGSPGDLLAPADRSANMPGLLVPASRGRALQRSSGTSLAAPRATRWLAMQLAAGADLTDRASIVAAASAQGHAGAPPVLADIGPLPWRDGL